jgi:hypothetical protein
MDRSSVSRLCWLRQGFLKVTKQAAREGKKSQQAEGKEEKRVIPCSTSEKSAMPTSKERFRGILRAFPHAKK